METNKQKNKHGNAIFNEWVRNLLKIVSDYLKETPQLFKTIYAFH